MNVLTELQEYLLEKLEQVNINNPKANSGAVLLKLYDNYEEDMDKILVKSIHTIQHYFTKETVEYPAGVAALTNTSIKIGKTLYRYMEREPTSWKDELRLGDLIIEAFYNCGLIELHYPARRDSSHQLLAAKRWTELYNIPESKLAISLSATLPTKIPSITRMVQNGHTLIKDRSISEELNLDTPFVKTVNKLQQTPWRINKRVLNALIDNDGFISRTEVKGNKQKELKRRSKLIEWKFIKTKANLLNKWDEFYQYISADYRGRLYYDEAFLNFQGSDYARGILQFAEGKPIDGDGNFWLAVHTANSFNQSYSIDEIPDWTEADYISYLQSEGLDSISVDKFTLEDRAMWTNQSIDWILEHGETCEFVMDAEKPISFLAACVEWYDMSNNPDHISHLPIGIDGSNNGWQHLGAISKDPDTGKLVGLVPQEIQKDFYVQTAKELISQTTDERLIEILEAMPMKKIRKGISKRGSMTRAYSAGASKIAENMYFDCKVEDYHEDYGITQQDCNKFARILIQAINTVCPGPLQTMAYFQALAAFEIGKYGVDPKLIARRKELNRISDPTSEDLEELNDISIKLEDQSEELVYGNGENTISWTTPSGFDVRYNSWTMHNYRCRGTISGYRQVNHVVQQPSDKPDIRGFMCGISPNFIHSMDASHMSLVIDQWDNTFGAVHDSFSTHASDVSDLLDVTKRIFIDMYDVDNFYDYIENEIVTNKDGLDVSQPQRGTLEIKEIEHSDYFFA